MQFATQGSFHLNQPLKMAIGLPLKNFTVTVNITHYIK